MKELPILLLAMIAAPVFSQAPASSAASVQPPAEAVSTKAELIPERTLKFTPGESNPGVALSPVTSLPQCDSDGTLFLDMLDPKDLKKHTVVSVRGRKSQLYSPQAISDLHDVTIFGFSPSDSVVGFLVRGTKEMQVSPGPGVSPGGFAWNGYRNYIAEFNLDGSYKGSIEISVSYQLSHLAILPSGEFLVTGYDRLNSTARLLFLNSSGQVAKTLDFPASRRSTGADAPYGSIDAARESRNLMGTVVFTSYGSDILVWRRESSDPILDVGPGGRVREVPLEVPSGYVFVDMIPSSDRWVAHFRRKEAPENLPFNETTYSYYELRPQDASIAAKLLISGDVPKSLACESDGHYVTYKADKDNKLVVFGAD